MWHILENVQQSYDLSDRLIRAIGGWQIGDGQDDIEELLDRGADVNKLHGTLLPLHCACMARDSETVELLLKHGAQVNAVDGYCRTALHYAAEIDDPSCVNILLSAGADIDARDGGGDTALHWASFRGSSRCVVALLERGLADVDAVDLNRATPLSWASKRPSAACVDVLLQYNASPDVADADGKTPINHVTMSPPGANRDASIVLLLRASGDLDWATVDRLCRMTSQAFGRRVINEFGAHCSGSRLLCQLCRLSIRRQLGRRYLPGVVAQLPLPSRLQDFLLLQN